MPPAVPRLEASTGDASVFDPSIKPVNYRRSLWNLKPKQSPCPSSASANSGSGGSDAPLDSTFMLEHGKSRAALAELEFLLEVRRYLRVLFSLDF